MLKIFQSIDRAPDKKNYMTKEVKNCPLKALVAVFAFPFKFSNSSRLENYLGMISLNLTYLAVSYVSSILLP